MKGSSFDKIGLEVEGVTNPDFEAKKPGSGRGASVEGVKINRLMNGADAEGSAFLAESTVGGEVESFLDSGNRGFFAKMSEDGRGIMAKMYDGLYKIPGVSRIVGKLEIAYNQAWKDRHQEKAVSLLGKMDNIEIKRSVLSQAKKEIESSIEELRRLGVPRVESLQLKLGKIDLEDAELLLKKNEIQSRFEERDNKVKLYANERDEIAGKLIGRYDEKLKPMEQELENLHALRDQADFVASAMEAKHEEKTKEIAVLEEKRTKIAELLKKTGSKDGEIKKTVEPLTSQIRAGQEKIKIEKANLARKQKEINKKIAKLDAKANPYRDKREEFVSVTKDRPLDVSVETRKRSREFTGKEKVGSHSREEAEAGLIEEVEAPSSVEDSRGAEDAESGRELDKRMTLGDYISSFNLYLEEKGSPEAKKMIIDPKDLVKGAVFLSKDSKMDFGRFKDVLQKYLKFKKIPLNGFEESIKGVQAKLEAEK